MVLGVLILGASYHHFYFNMIRHYEGIAEEILNHASDDIIIDHIPDYVSGDYDRQEYAATQAKLNKYVEYYSEIYYLYGYKINAGSDIATVIFDAQTNHDEVEHLGDDYELEDDIVENLDKLERGEPIESLIDNTEWGYLMTCSKPLIGSDGQCKGYLFVDFNLTETRKMDLIFILQLFIVIVFVVLFILFLAMKAVTNRITGPVEKMYMCLKGFRFETDEDRENNIARLRELDIRTNPEIQSLYDALVSTTLESYTYQQEYEVASEKLGEASEMAFKDALTGAGNKNAYENTLKILQSDLDRSEHYELSILMMDVNNLKYINDTFGHDHGDSYIIGCCEVLKTLTRDSQIFRVGGDEFVVVFGENDYKIRENIFFDIEKSFAKSYGDTARDPWERYSASIGIANLLEDDDSISDVIKRADSAMYEAKVKFKEKHGSYR